MAFCDFARAEALLKRNHFDYLTGGAIILVLEYSITDHDRA
jgi:hypothetical protein